MMECMAVTNKIRKNRVLYEYTIKAKNFKWAEKETEKMEMETEL